MHGCILDSSVVLAARFPDEQPDYALRTMSSLQYHTALVPHIWPVEVANAFHMGERRGRCSQEDVTRWLAALMMMPIHVDEVPASVSWMVTVTFARTFRLSAYDASYLELALRRGLPLATLDDRLIAAAKKLGIRVFAPD